MHSGSGLQQQNLVFGQFAEAADLTAVQRGCEAGRWGFPQPLDGHPSTAYVIR